MVTNTGPSSSDGNEKRTWIETTFRALRVRNFRLYYLGQIFSITGQWMQTVAQSWLVLDLTGSAFSVGSVVAVQFLPVLLLGPWGGLVADRFDKRRLLMVTQGLLGLTAGGLAAVVLTGRVSLWMVYVAACGLGFVRAFDNPTSQSFVMEMVGRDRVTNAVSLYSVMINVTRIVGPALGGAIIVVSGVGVCFLVNGITYLVVIASLIAMQTRDLDVYSPVASGRGQLREALRRIRSDSSLWFPLLATAFVSMFVYQFEVVLPLLARFDFDGGADTFGILYTAGGVGSVVGGLYAATRAGGENAPILRSLLVLAGAALALATSPSLWVALSALVVVGGAGTSFMALANSRIQLASPSHMRGRMMAARAVAFLGTRPVGALAAGWLSERWGARTAIALGSLTTAAFAFWGRSHSRRPPSDEPYSEEEFRTGWPSS